MDNDLIYTTFIKTTAAQLWDAITTPEFCKQYWGAMANVSDWTVGADWSHVDTDSDNAVRLHGKVLECAPPTRLVLSWIGKTDPSDTSQVSFDILQLDGVVKLVVTHSGFRADSVMRGNVSKGWPAVLSSMKSFLETGKPINMKAILGKPNSGASAAA